ncbi:MAG: YhbY family RNA-binding protein [Betaproteobacteria bacterium]|nr:YhbY family RNA-binding protein [Betaproteobacteria bacterium]
MTKTISTDERSALRARAHRLKPVVMVSGAGLSEAVVAEIDRCLTHHELIKIRVFSDDRRQREALLGEICSRVNASPVQHIGKILVVYRETPVPEPAKTPGTRRVSTARRDRKTPPGEDKPAHARRPPAARRRRALKKPPRGASYS